MNDVPGSLHDEAQRSAALDATRSFIVQAPAGSGKTELLIQRYLALLAQVERPEAIVAMTFTRKAAGEIRERILGALRAPEPLQPDPNRALTSRLARAALERDRALGWDLAAHPARLQIHTIDALCMALTRQAPLTSKVGAQPRPVERAESLYTEAAREELFAAIPLETGWRCLLEHLDNDAERAVQLIAMLLAKREQWLGHVVSVDPVALRARLEQTLANEIASTVEALVALIPRPLLGQLAELAHYAAGNLALTGDDALAAFAVHASRPPAAEQGVAYWQSMAAWLLASNGRIRRSVNARQGFPKAGIARKQRMERLLGELEALPGLPEALRRVLLLPRATFDEGTWSFVEALLDVLPRAAARLRLVFLRRAVIDFNEATLIALNALKSDGGPSDLLIALDTRIEHLLVDEFQDTSFAQVALIQRLTAEWTCGDGRTLFLVGDPMQSIYRFRDANVGLFLEARQRRRLGSVALESLTLRSNFRSQGALVDWINQAFARVFPRNDEPARGEVAFTPAVAARSERTDPGMTLDIAIDDRSEAAYSIARIHAALKTAARKIAVLVRKRGDLADLLPALRAAGISFTAVELDRLSQRQAVLDLAALTHALIQPDDRAAWLAVLRAPWCGLTLRDLFALVEACEPQPLVEALCGARVMQLRSGLSDDGRVRLERFAQAVMPALVERGRVPLARRVRATWLALGGPACLTEPAVDLAAAERVFGLIAEHAIGADVQDWPAFQAELEALHAQSEIDPGTRVQIMTLHRAKGLEFDVVVMPGLTRPPGSSEAQLLLWRERSSGLILAPIRARALAKGRDDPIYEYLRALEKDENDAELRRLLYVGCTRAKTSLHLVATLRIEHEADGSRRWKKPPRGTLLSALWPALNPAPPEMAASARSMREIGTRISGVPLERLSLSWRLPEPPPSVPLLYEPPARGQNELVEFAWAHEAARRIGTLAHRLLARIATEGLEGWTRERIAAERPHIERELAQAGFTGEEARAAIEQVALAIEKTLADPRGRWLFDRRHVDARSEYALTESRGGAFEHRVLDRTFVDAQGTRWVVDFKLSRHEGGGLDEFLDRERERYAEQLHGYAAVMRALDSRPIRLGLYFPLLAGWREWAAPEA